MPFKRDGILQNPFGKSLNKEIRFGVPFHMEVLLLLSSIFYLEMLSPFLNEKKK